MTVTSTNDRRANVSGDGAILVFAYDFLILANTDIQVYHVDSAGAATLLTLTTDYTVSGVSVAGGGNVTLTAAYAVAGTPSGSESILMLGETAKTQLTNLLQNGAYNAEVQEAIGDKLTLIANEFQRELDRSLTLALSDNASSVSPILPVAAADKSFIWNATGTALIEGPTASEISGAVTSAAAAAVSAAAAAADAVLTAADLVLTNADVVLTNADVVSTAADVVSTAADLVLTNLDQISADADATATAADAVQTALDVIATAADVVTTNADVVLTTADAVATAADLVLTDADQISAAASAVSAAASAASVPNMDAYAGVLEANANFVDQAIFGPSVDGQSWNGKWSVASLYSSLMLATIEDTGSDTQVNIWDLTEVSSSAPSTTPLGTVTLSGAATPTSVAACQGYICVGSEDGIAIIDPHSGAWAERTVGWPRSLSTGTTPALTDNDIDGVCAGFAQQPAHDPRTGGPMPTFGAYYGTGADVGVIIKDNGTVIQIAGSDVTGAGVAIMDGQFYIIDNSNGRCAKILAPIDAITADDPGGASVMNGETGYPEAFDLTYITASGGKVVGGGGNGFTGIISNASATEATARGIPSFKINRTYNTGHMVGDIRGAWLANSKTVDRSYKANTLTENGTVTEAAVASGAELMGYSGFSSSNSLTRTSDADWNSLGTGNAYWSVWFKSSGPSTTEVLTSVRSSGATEIIEIQLLSTSKIRGLVRGASAQTYIDTVGNFGDGVWHKADFVQVSSAERHLYLDGKLEASGTTDSGSLTGTLTMGIGVAPNDNTSNPADSSTLSLARLSATVPTATQIRQMYIAERGLFEANAECLLQSGSTDAVLDVDVDPLTGKVLVTQTDAITIFDGLAVDSKPTVNAGASEKGKLWGDLRAEQNSANAYVTAPAIDQRQVNEMVRSLASELPQGVDLSKAKAWISFNGTGTIAIRASYNVKSIVDVSTGRYTIHFAVPFKSAEYVAMGSDGNTTAQGFTQFPAGEQYSNQIQIDCVDHAGSFQDQAWVYALFFGELENE